MVVLGPGDAVEREVKDFNIYNVTKTECSNWLREGRRGSEMTHVLGLDGAVSQV